MSLALVGLRRLVALALEVWFATGRELIARTLGRTS